MQIRTGESGNIPSRQERLFMKENYWYFTTREGFNIGPFDSHDHASQGVSNFIDYVSNAEPAVVNRITQTVKAA